MIKLGSPLCGASDQKEEDAPLPYKEVEEKGEIFKTIFERIRTFA